MTPQPNTSPSSHHTHRDAHTPRTHLYALLLSTLLYTTSCSLIVDLPADCDPAQCGGFACDDTRTECLFICSQDDDCAPSHTCSNPSEINTCTPRACIPIGDLQTLLPNANTTFTPITSSNTTHIAAAYVTSSNGLAFILYDTEGTPSGPPIILDESPNVPLFPSIAWDGSSWLVAWQGANLQGQNSKPQVRFASISADGLSFNTPTQGLWTNQGVQERGVQNVHIAWDPSRNHAIITWSTHIQGTPQLFALPILPNGNSPQTPQQPPDHDDAIQLTQNTTPSTSPQLFIHSTPSLWTVLFTQDTSSIASLTYNPDDATLSTISTIHTPTEPTELLEYHTAPQPDGSTLLLSLERNTTNPQPQLFATSLSPSLEPTNTRTLLSPPTLTDTQHLRTTTHTSSTTLAFTASLRNQPSIFITPLSSNTQPILPTHSTSLSTASNPLHPILQAFPNSPTTLLGFASDNRFIGNLYTCE